MRQADVGNIISSEKLANTVVEFDYDANGGFDYGASLNFYFNGNRYSTISATGLTNDVYDYDVASGTADTPDYLGFDNNADSFGFYPNHMALIYWKLEDNVAYEAYGFGIAGFETTGSAIPSTEANVKFVGKGGGHHYAGEFTENISFDVILDIDFTASNKQITFSTINSCASDCETGDDRAYLDFTNQKLSYAAQTNAITGTVRTGSVTNTFTPAPVDGVYQSPITIDLYPSLAGTANARFYGPEGEEIGGTFSVGTNYTDQIVYVWDATAKGGAGDWVETIESTFLNTATRRSYFGWFGAKSLASIDKPNQAELNANNLRDFNDYNRELTTNVLPVANAVEMFQSSDRSISTLDRVGVAVEFTYGTPDDDVEDGYVQPVNNYIDFEDGESLNLYFNHKTYKATNADGSTDFIHDDDVGSGSAATPDYFGLTKEETYFGFAPDYMALVYWKLYENVAYESYGYGIAGFKTKHTDMPITTNGFGLRFEGKGDGHHYFETISENIYFDIVIYANFTAHRVKFTTENSCANDCEVGDDRNYLKFNKTLDYQAGINAVKGDIETFGGGDGNNTNWSQLSGTLNASFYGPNADEIGGTFAVSNSSNRSYVGWFGANRP